MGDATGWRPAGPLFSVFAVATCAGIPAVPADIPAAFAVASVSAAFAVVVGLGGALSPTRRARERASSPPFGVRRLVEESAVRGHALAALAAVVPLAVSDTPGQLLRASHRLGGTAVGLVVAAGLFALHPAGWELVIVVVVLQTVAELFVVRSRRSSGPSSRSCRRDEPSLEAS